MQDLNVTNVCKHSYQVVPFNRLTCPQVGARECLEKSALNAFVARFKFFSRIQTGYPLVKQAIPNLKKCIAESLMAFVLLD
jgi:hypothetical protein